MRDASPEATLQELRRENERLRRAVEELALLNDLAAAVGAASNLDAVLEAIVARAVEAVRAEQGAITLVKPDAGPQGTLIRAMDGTSEHEPLRPGDALLGWMLHHQQALVVNDPAADPRFRGAINGAIRSLLTVPLHVRARLTGLLTVYNKRGGNGFLPEDVRLLSILAAQSAQVVENARLQEEERQLVRVREALRLAAEIQARLLPASPPEIPGYDLAAAMRPAEDVGGDYYDFIPLEPGRLGLGVGDVIGKGLPAALLMANVQATLRGQARWVRSVADCLAWSNVLLHASTRRGTFVTLVCVVLDYERHEVRYANAGHNPPLHVSASGTVTRLTARGLPLGAVREATYPAETVPLAPGDTLVLYTDGVTEAMDAERRQFGEERLEALVRAHHAEPAAQLVERVLSAVREHAGSAPASDDVTVLVVRRL